MKETILIVDDERLVRFSLEKELSRQGYLVFSADHGKAGISLVEEESPDLVLLDLKLPDLNGIEVLKRLREMDKNLAVLIITAYGSIDTAIQAIKSGAYDYITKPFDLEAILLSIRKALEASRLQREVTYFSSEHRRTFASACTGLSAKVRPWPKYVSGLNRLPKVKPPPSCWKGRAEREKIW
ncbi:MAG: response regulator [Thermodesulfobacteriota bacterium]|nr:response regulator [Thermodesulfobacteriota bacterium]